MYRFIADFKQIVRLFIYFKMHFYLEHTINSFLQMSARKIVMYAFLGKDLNIDKFSISTVMMDVINPSHSPRKL
jgi:hypothetical protein